MLTSFMGSNGNRALKSKSLADRPQLLNYEAGAELDRGRLVDALSELHDLLEQYAPSWYTQEHHEKALAALRPLRKR